MLSTILRLSLELFSTRQMSEIKCLKDSQSRRLKKVFFLELFYILNEKEKRRTDDPNFILNEEHLSREEDARKAERSEYRSVLL